MLTYTVRLPGARTLNGRLSGRVLGETMHALLHSAAGALRLRVEGRSATRADRLPGWLERGADFVFMSYTEEGPGFVIQTKSLAEAVPERFEQCDLFMPLDPNQSALSVMAASLSEAAAGRADSDAFDVDLLGVFTRDFARLFRRSGVEAVSVRNGAHDSPRLDLDALGLRTVSQLRDRTPRPRRVRLAGYVDVIRYSTCSFTMRLEDGAVVRGVLTEDGPEALRTHYGATVVVEGTAQFRPSGRLLRVDVDRIAAASRSDISVFSSEPRPLEEAVDPRRLHRHQGPKTGLNAAIGRWPGDETDEQIMEYLHEIS
jgi:hypothetical protein